MRRRRKGGAMPDIDWKTWTAIWGAVTGTVSLALILFSKRPRFHWEPYDGSSNNYLYLVVENPSQSHLMISRISAIPKGHKFFPVRRPDSQRSSTHDLAAWEKSKNIPVFVKPNDSRKIRVNIKDRSSALIILYWHRYWIFPVRIPKILWLSRKIADEINAAAAQMRPPQVCQHYAGAALPAAQHFVYAG
jgi:hypothetical protein